MTLFVLAVLLAIVAAGWVIHPLVFRRWGLLGDKIPTELLDNEARKRVALAALKDVEYDRAAGKLDDADYLAIREQLEREALQALEAIGTPASRKGISAAAVHACGFRNPARSRFCAGCGKALA